MYASNRINESPKEDDFDNKGGNGETRTDGNNQTAIQPNTDYMMGSSCQHSFAVSSQSQLR